jgi:hypothetical protein
VYLVGPHRELLDMLRKGLPPSAPATREDQSAADRTGVGRQAKTG